MRKFSRKIVFVTASLALGAAPAVALAAGHPGNSQGPPTTVTTGPPTNVTTGPPSTVTTGPPSTVTTGPPTNVTTGPPSTVTAGPPSTTPASNRPANQGSTHRSTNAGGHGSSHGPTSAGGKGRSHKPSTPGPKAGLPAKAKAYGRYCNDESKSRVPGKSGTYYSQCVTAMAKVATGVTGNPTIACRGMSKEHAPGAKGTPFGQCVSGARRLQHRQSSGGRGR